MLISRHFTSSRSFAIVIQPAAVCVPPDDVLFVSSVCLPALQFCPNFPLGTISLDPNQTAYNHDLGDEGLPVMFCHGNLIVLEDFCVTLDWASA